MLRITSGRVIARFSLQPSRPGPPKSAGVRSAAWMAVPMAPSSTSTRSDRSEFKVKIRSLRSIIAIQAPEATHRLVQVFAPAFFFLSCLHQLANLGPPVQRNSGHRDIDDLEGAEGELAGGADVLVSDISLLIDKESADDNLVIGG